MERLHRQVCEAPLLDRWGSTTWGGVLVVEGFLMCGSPQRLSATPEGPLSQVTVLPRSFGLETADPVREYVESVCVCFCLCLAASLSVRTPSLNVWGQSWFWVFS